MGKTFTKKVVIWMLIVGTINGSLPFLLSAFGKDPVVELGIAWTVQVVALIVGYLIKSFKENKQKAIQKHEDFVVGMFNEDTSEVQEEKAEG